jgi:hypothetical protein
MNYWVIIIIIIIIFVVITIIIIFIPVVRKPKILNERGTTTKLTCIDEAYFLKLAWINFNDLFHTA